MRRRTTLFLRATTAAPRHAATRDVLAAVDRCGDLLAATPFANVALALRFELRPSRAGRLLELLERLPLDLAAESGAALCGVVAEDDLPVPVALRITFLRDEPDLRVPVPAVPG